MYSGMCPFNSGLESINAEVGPWEWDKLGNLLATVDEAWAVYVF